MPLSSVTVENLSFVTQRGYVDNPLTACPPAWVIVPSPVLVRRGASGEANSSTQDLAVGETRDAVAQTGGTGLIVGPGCVLPMNTPDANVAAVVQALGGPLKKIPGVAP